MRDNTWSGFKDLFPARGMDPGWFTPSERNSIDFCLLIFVCTVEAGRGAGWVVAGAALGLRLSAAVHLVQFIAGIVLGSAIIINITC